MSASEGESTYRTRPAPGFRRNGERGIASLAYLFHRARPDGKGGFLEVGADHGVQGVLVSRLDAGKERSLMRLEMVGNLLAASAPDPKYAHDNMAVRSMGSMGMKESILSSGGIEPVLKGVMAYGYIPVRV